MTLNSKNVLSRFEYTSQENGGQGVLSIALGVPFSYTGIAYGDVIKVLDNLGATKYSGFVNSIRRVHDAKNDYVEYECIGLASVLSQVVFNNGPGIYKRVSTAEPYVTVGSILSQVNALYPAISASGSIKTLGTTVKIEFSGQTCREALDTIADLTGWRRYLGPTGILIFGDDAYFSSGILTLGGNVESIEVNETGDTLTNSVIVETTSIGIVSGVEVRTPIYTLYENAGSITANGKRQVLQSKASYTDVTTGGVFGTQYLAKNKDITRKMSIVCNSYDSIVNTLKPGDLVNIRGTAYAMKALEISQIRYGEEKTTILVKSLENFTKVLQNQ